MKIHLDDPKLTAYALDELGPAERQEFEQALVDSPEGREFVREIRLLSGNLRAEYDAERFVDAQLPRNILPLEQRDDPWSFSRRLALAASIALCACLGALAVGTWERAGRLGVARMVSPPPATVFSESAQTPIEGVVEGEAPEEESAPAAPPASGDRSETLAKGESSATTSRPRTAFSRPYAARRQPNDINAANDPAFNTARYGLVEENPFLAAATSPLSTFSIDVDTASYANVRRFLDDNQLPPKDAIRVEEMINYFSYNYPQPDDRVPFSVNLDAAACPWAPGHRLVRLGLQGRALPNEKRPPSNLVFLLDVSGSMMPANRLPLVKRALRLLVSRLGEKDHVAVVVYAGASGLALPSTAGDHKEEILRALETLQAGGSTNGAQGIELAYRTATEHFIPGGVNRVILATDGDFNVGTTSEGDLVRLIEEKAKSGVFLSVLGVGDDNLNDAMMQKLADKGNGNYAYLDSLGEAEKVLVRQINGTLVTIAKDVKIQVEFNPAKVASYRLIGYEKRLLRKEDFNNDQIDAGEIGAGHSVTALYEVVPVGASPNPAASVPPVDSLKYQAVQPSPAPGSIASASSELLTVKLRYKEPEGATSRLIERPFVDPGSTFAMAAPDLKFAAAVAEFGMILRDSKYRGDGSLGAVAQWAEAGKGTDENGYRAGFLELVRKARELKAQM